MALLFNQEHRHFWLLEALDQAQPDVYHAMELTDERKPRRAVCLTVTKDICGRIAYARIPLSDSLIADREFPLVPYLVDKLGAVFDGLEKDG